MNNFKSLEISQSCMNFLSCDIVNDLTERINDLIDEIEGLKEYLKNEIVQDDLDSLDYSEHNLNDLKDVVDSLGDDITEEEAKGINAKIDNIWDEFNKIKDKYI